MPQLLPAILPLLALHLLCLPFLQLLLSELLGAQLLLPLLDLCVSFLLSL